MDKFQQLLEQRSGILREIAQLGPMRKGSVYEFRPAFTRKDGSRKSRGPYLTYTCKKQGKSVAKHLRGDEEARRYREQIARRRRFEKLAAQFAEISERMADLELLETEAKKNSRS